MSFPYILHESYISGEHHRIPNIFILKDILSSPRPYTSSRIQSLEFGYPSIRSCLYLVQLFIEFSPTHVRRPDHRYCGEPFSSKLERYFDKWRSFLVLSLGTVHLCCFLLVIYSNITAAPEIWYNIWEIYRREWTYSGMGRLLGGKGPRGLIYYHLRIGYLPKAASRTLLHYSPRPSPSLFIIYLLL